MHNNALDWNETAVKQAMDECDSVPYLMIGSLGLGAVALAFTKKSGSRHSTCSHSI